MAPRVLAARWLTPEPGTWLESAGVEVVAGRVSRLLRGRAALRRARDRGARVVELEGALAPGLVDAHAHLELTGLAGRLPRGGSFAGWIRALLAERPSDRRALERAVSRGAARLLATGTTTVGDVDSTGASERVLASAPLRARLYREVLDVFDPRRTAAALERVRRTLPRRAGLREGVSPHAPYTVSDALLSGVGDVVARRGVACSIHWAETEEELDWERGRGGPLAGLIDAAPPMGPALDRLERAGLLGPGTALVHANLPGRGEVARIAAAGSVVVHCPGAHAYFGRPAFPFWRYRKAGVPVALGTDSLAGNDDLSMLREMALLRRSLPSVSPEDAWRAATTDAARALGFADEVGLLRPGYRADLVLYSEPRGAPREALEALTSGALEPLSVWVSGLRVRAGEGGGRAA